MVPETRVFQAADGKDLVILACTVFDFIWWWWWRRAESSSCLHV